MKNALLELDARVEAMQAFVSEADNVRDRAVLRNINAIAARIPMELPSSLASALDEDSRDAALLGLLGATATSASALDAVLQRVEVMRESGSGRMGRGGRGRRFGPSPTMSADIMLAGGGFAE